MVGVSVPNGAFVGYESDPSGHTRAALFGATFSPGEGGGPPNGFLVGGGQKTLLGPIDMPLEAMTFAASGLEALFPTLINQRFQLNATLPGLTSIFVNAGLVASWVQFTYGRK
jgi:hypothetical protein